MLKELIERITIADDYFGNYFGRDLILFARGKYHIEDLKNKH